MANVKWSNMHLIVIPRGIIQKKKFEEIIANMSSIRQMQLLILTLARLGIGNSSEGGSIACGQQLFICGTRKSRCRRIWRLWLKRFLVADSGQYEVMTEQTSCRLLQTNREGSCYQFPGHFTFQRNYLDIDSRIQISCSSQQPLVSDPDAEILEG